MRGSSDLTIPLFQVDAFTSKPFGGNPAAVCLLAEPASRGWMQSVAAEMNLSETAFVVPAKEGFGLRWFTPAMEVDLCGHATLASAHVLWSEGRLPGDAPAHFHTRSGLLTARRSGGAIEMDFPADPVAPCEVPEGLLAALGVPAQSVWRGRFDYLVVLEEESSVREIRPDFQLLGSVPTRGVIVTAAARMAGYDFVSRFFGPAVGINEDPATGSAHCCLGPFWGERLGLKELRGYQASRRGGSIGVGLKGDRVVLTGEAVTVLRGDMLL